MKPVLRIGLIGCGQIAQAVHLRVLARLPDVEIVAIADPDPTRLDAARRLAPAAVVVADYWDLLQLSQLDAVIISLPNSLHAEVAKLAFQQGRHVYLEKPIATSVDDARALVAAWRGASVVGMVGFNYRFNPLYAEVRDHVQAGRLGDVIAIRTVFSTPVQSLPDWKRHRATGGGVLLDLASHHVDLVRFFLGREVIEVSCQLQSLRSEGDTATLQLTLSGGTLVQSLFSLCASEEDRIEVYGSAGKLAVDRYSSADVEITPVARDAAPWQRLGERMLSPVKTPYFLRKLRAIGNEPSFQAALAHFVEAALAKHAVTPDMYDGYQSLAIIEAAETSARVGRAVAPRSGFSNELRRVTPASGLAPVSRGGG